jgi:hypothetical protein
VLSPDHERLAQFPSCAPLVTADEGNQESVAAIREAFSGLETDAVPERAVKHVRLLYVHRPAMAEIPLSKRVPPNQT